MTRGNRPRGRADSSRPRATSARDVYRASSDRLDTVLASLPRREQTTAYLGHADLINHLADAAQQRVGRRARTSPTQQKPSSGR